MPVRLQPGRTTRIMASSILEGPGDCLTDILPNRRHKRMQRIGLLCLVGIPTIIVVVGLLQQGRPRATTPPPADGEPGRWVYIDGAENTRDLGGYRTKDGRTVRRGLVYRSGTLSHVTRAGCETFHDLGIVTVVDFRNRLSALPLYNGDVLGIHLAARVYGIPMSFKAQDPWEEFYLAGFRDHQDAFRRTFELLAREDRLPLLFHCRDGTDRTGTVAALLLALLGVDRETIIAEFRLSEQVGKPGSLDAMRRLLNEVENRGGIERFLADAGIAPEIQQRIRELLLTQ